MDITVHVVPDLANVLAQLVATVILFLVVRHFIYQPMTEFLNKRKTQVTQDLKEAEDSKAQAQDLKAQYEDRLQDARRESQVIIDESRERGREIQEAMENRGQEEADRLVKLAMTQIDQERAQVQDQMVASASELGLAIAEKLIGQGMDPEVQDRLVKELVKDLEEDHGL